MGDHQQASRIESRGGAGWERANCSATSAFAAHAPAYQAGYRSLVDCLIDDNGEYFGNGRILLYDHYSISYYREPAGLLERNSLSKVGAYPA